MPVPSTIADLSTVAADNYPRGGEAAFPLLDDYLRSHAAIIKQLDAAIASALALKQDASGNFPYSQLTGVPAVRLYNTGDIVPNIGGASAPAGTLLCNGLTIGSASSGATAQANADTQALFAWLWIGTTNAELVIQTSAGANTTRGASAAADFAANKRLPLPSLQDGEALVAAVSSVVGARTVGAVIGHGHSVNDPGHAHSYNFTNIGGGSQGTGPNPSLPVSGGTINTGGSGTGVTVLQFGGTKNLPAGLYTRIYIAL